MRSTKVEYERWMNPKLQDRMYYHLDEILQCLDHFCSYHDVTIELSIRIDGKKYDTFYRKRLALMGSAELGLLEGNNNERLSIQGSERRKRVL